MVFKVNRFQKHAFLLTVHGVNSGVSIDALANKNKMVLST